MRQELNGLVDDVVKKGGELYNNQWVQLLMNGYFLYSFIKGFQRWDESPYARVGLVASSVAKVASYADDYNKSFPMGAIPTEINEINKMDKNKKIAIGLFAGATFVIIGGVVYYFVNKNKDKNKNNTSQKEATKNAAYSLPSIPATSPTTYNEPEPPPSEVPAQTYAQTPAPKPTTPKPPKPTTTNNKSLNYDKELMAKPFSNELLILQKYLNSKAKPPVLLIGEDGYWGKETKGRAENYLGRYGLKTLTLRSFAHQLPIIESPAFWLFVAAQPLSGVSNFGLPLFGLE